MSLIKIQQKIVNLSLKIFILTTHLNYSMWHVDALPRHTGVYLIMVDIMHEKKIYR